MSTNPMPPASSSPVVNPQATPLDQRLFLAAAFVGLLLIGSVVAFVVVKHRQEQREAAKPTARLDGPGKPLPTRIWKDFSLIDQSGRSLKSVDLKGKYLVVNAVFTSCSISCMQVNYHMASIQNALRGQPDVMLVSMTVDPITDTPPMLLKFSQRFGADTNQWRFVTGESDTLQSLIETSFRIPDAEKEPDAAPPGFLNTSRIAVVDPTGKVRAIFKGLKPAVTNEVPAFIKSLMEATPPR